MAATVYWVREIQSNQAVKSVIEHIYKSYGDESHVNHPKVLITGDALPTFKSTLGSTEEFGGETGQHSVFHPVELLVGIYRKNCSKNPPFCNSIYGLTDQLISLQLVMAQKNKEDSGQFEAGLDDVIQAHQAITQAKLNGAPVNNCTMHADEYYKFLNHCNAVDYADVVNMVSQCFKSDDAVRDLHQDQQPYIIIGLPSTVIEIAILSLLIGSRDVVQISSEKAGPSRTLTKKQFDDILKHGHESNHQSEHIVRMDNSAPPSTPSHPNKHMTSVHVTPQHLTGLSGRHTPMCLSGEQSPMLSQSSFSQGRKTMGHSLSVFMSYLQLLVNSRDELALARVINTPDRELGIRQFNKIKRLSKEKNMTMFQMVTSFILKIRLGGKSYAPSRDNPLHFMSKGLGEFVSFFQKLQNILEEVPDSKSAVQKIISLLQTTFIKACDTTLSGVEVREASNHLKTQIDNIVNENKGLEMELQKCMIGAQSYMLLQSLLDQNVLYDYEEKDLHCALKTPLRTKGMTCSLLSKFRTPDGPTPGKSQELEQTLDEHRNKPKVKQHGDMSLAKPAVDITARKSIWQMSEDTETETTCKIFNNDTPKSSSRKRPFAENCGPMGEKSCSPLRKKPYESKQDQENMQPKDQDGDKCSKRPVAKRILVKDKSLNKKKGTKAGTTQKKKTVKIAQGQKQLTHFFR